jgi:hypothetical protein
MSETDEQALIKVVWGEASGESETGRVAVAWVVKNRSTKKGTTIQTEASKANQFYGYNAYNKKPPDPKKPCDKKAIDEITAIVRSILSNETLESGKLKYPDPTAGATHFHTSETPPQTACFGNMVKQGDNEVFVAVKSHTKIGGHYFFKGIAPYK